MESKLKQLKASLAARVSEAQSLLLSGAPAGAEGSWLPAFLAPYSASARICLPLDNRVLSPALVGILGSPPRPCSLHKEMNRSGPADCVWTLPFMSNFDEA